MDSDDPAAADYDMAVAQIDDLIYVLEPKLFGLLFLGVIILGICISVISTFFAVNRYLNIKKDELYYR